jgi:hypothetical protein
MAPRVEWRFFILIGLFVLLLVTAPFLLASRASMGDYVFGGFLFNPYDGNSYLAKMCQGWAGSWRFKLPFSAEQGDGAYLFLFYLGLGHLARITQLPMITLFHITRIICAGVLLWVLWFFWGKVFDEPGPCKLAFALSALGSGMGWVAVPFGEFTADFWVAETYPFLSAYANPHFSLGLAMVLWLVMPGGEQSTRISDRVWSLIIAFFLGVINPFGVVVVLMVLAGMWLWDFFRMGVLSGRFYGYKQIVESRLLWAALGGGPVVLYDVWATTRDPVLTLWNAQNLTPSPPLWDLCLSLSPALLLSVFSIWYLLRRLDQNDAERSEHQRDPLRVLVVWLILGLIMLYAPVGLQRRFMMGLYVPVVGLAVFCVEVFRNRYQNRAKILVFTLFILSLPTNLMVLMAANYGIRTHDPSIYLHQDEVDALDWIRGSTPIDALVLASPEMGLYIPAYTGRRVIYGHPFESVNAEMEESLVVDFYEGKLADQNARSFLTNREVDYIFFGPREQALGEQPLINKLTPTFEMGGVAVFRLDQ